MARILIADDDPIVCAMVSEILSNEGYDVFEASDGVEALALIRRLEIDLLIVDMLMPNKDGLETIMELRRTGWTRPILAISSGGRMDVSSLLRPAATFGADQVQSKPVRAAVLISSVKELLATSVRNQSAGAVG